jgi:hypothetical protein
LKKKVDPFDYAGFRSFRCFRSSRTCVVYLLPRRFEGYHGAGPPSPSATRVSRIARLSRVLLLFPPQAVPLSSTVAPSPPSQSQPSVLSILAQYYPPHTPSLEETLNKEAKSYAKLQLSGYNAAPSIALTDDPLEWWSRHESLFPCLAQIAREFLAIPASSAPAERVFKMVRGLLDPLRWYPSPISLPDTALTPEPSSILSS